MSYLLMSVFILFKDQMTFYFVMNCKALAPLIHLSNSYPFLYYIKVSVVHCVENMLLNTTHNR